MQMAGMERKPVYLKVCLSKKTSTAFGFQIAMLGVEIPAFQ
jgi:hypothetical protein